MNKIEAPLTQNPQAQKVPTDFNNQGVTVIGIWNSAWNSYLRWPGIAIYAITQKECKSRNVVDVILKLWEQKIVILSQKFITNSTTKSWFLGKNKSMQLALGHPLRQGGLVTNHYCIHQVCFASGAHPTQTAMSKGTLAAESQGY